MLTPGSVFARDYRIVRRLAEGGMGAVYVAEQISTGKQRALKVMHPRMLHDASLRERFTQEARLGAKIASDHVVEVVGAGVDPQMDIPWMAMELLQGSDLSATLLARGAFGLDEAQDVMRQAGHALGRAHGLGIVHRDLKPENLFLAESRRDGGGSTVKILDFGIAKVMQETRATGATLGGLGTPLWMAPEQTHGGAITPATDVWALGLIGFALLAGRSYWKCATEDAPLQVVLMEMFAAPLVTPSERVAELGLGVRLPAGFDQWFAKCVARDAAERFPSAEPCIAAFLALPTVAAVAAVAPTAVAVAAVAPTAVGDPSVPWQPTVAEAALPSRPRPRRAWSAVVVAAAVLLPALSFGAWAVVRATRPEAPPRASLSSSELTEQRPTVEVPVTPVAVAPPPAPVVAPPVVTPPAPVEAPPAVTPPAPVVATAPRAPTPRPAVRPAPPRVVRPAAPPSPPPYSAVQPAPAPPAPSPPPVVMVPEHDPQVEEGPRPWRRRPRGWRRPMGDPGATEEPAMSAPVAPACGACTQGTRERCNGCDDNCNGIVDEGCS